MSHCHHALIGDDNKEIEANFERVKASELMLNSILFLILIVIGCVYYDCNLKELLNSITEEHLIHCIPRKVDYMKISQLSLAKLPATRTEYKTIVNSSRH